MREHLLWEEKYRPHKIEDCILPKDLKQTFEAFRDKGFIPNMTFSGTPGCGKTTVAIALCDELEYDHYLINCSENGNIDTLRTDIRNYASTYSVSGKRKCVILDEADGLTKATQQALRPFIEEFASGTSFILTCNFTNQIIDALKDSRCPSIKFKPTKEDIKPMAIAFHKRVISILKAENIAFDEKVLTKIIVKHFPDFRGILVRLQRFAQVGRIDADTVSAVDDIPIKDLVKHLKEKNFAEMRKWVSTNSINEPIALYRSLFDNSNELLEKESLPYFIMILGDSIDQASRSLDQEICLTACLTRMMGTEEIVWK
jgi:DNA polymerase III delta prime subunit